MSVITYWPLSRIVADHSDALRLPKRGGGYPPPLEAKEKPNKLLLGFAAEQVLRPVYLAVLIARPEAHLQDGAICVIILRETSRLGAVLACLIPEPPFNSALPSFTAPPSPLVESDLPKNQFGPWKPLITFGPLTHYPKLAYCQTINLRLRFE